MCEFTESDIQWQLDRMDMIETIIDGKPTLRNPTREEAIATLREIENERN